jgi:transglutaminase-like putative cysteine protease
LWVSDNAGKTIHRVDPQDGTTIREVPFPGKSVDGLAFDGHYLWVADRLADKLYAVHPPSSEVLVTLKAPGPHATGLGWDGKNLVVVDYQTDKIYTIRRDDDKFVIREDPRDAWVVFTHQVRNFGPDPLPELDIFLAYPQDLVSQKLLSTPAFEPRPVEMLADQWGQKVARFHFKNHPARKAATVKMKVNLKAYTVHWVIYPEKVQSLWKIPSEIRRKYLVDNPKYDIKNPIIKKAIKEAVGSEKNPYWIARKIYRIIHQKMHYEMVGGWDVAPKVFARGSGSCSEYSYVFIAMCRAAGLPARYVGSLVVRKDDASYDDVYHRWVEVYLPPYGWIPVDPSRGDKPSEAERADSFGHLYHDFLITTHGGGGSNLLGWNYNYNERYTCKGRCKVEVEAIAEWSPEDPGKAD